MLAYGFKTSGRMTPVNTELPVMHQCRQAREAGLLKVKPESEGAI